MKFQKVLIATLAFLCSIPLFAQHKDFDLGIMFGTTQYNGDVNMIKPYYSPQPAIALLYKKNYNSHYSLRFAATIGNLKANDLDFDNAYQIKREFFFDDTRIIEFSAGVEFNFYEITPDKKSHNFSPFVTFGLGAMYLEDVKFYEVFNIPMGLGLKYKVTSRIELRCEWTFRKTFTDKLDQLANESRDGYLQYKQISFNKTKDWFSVAGLSVMFNFNDGKAPCHIYDQRKYDYKRKK